MNELVGTLKYSEKLSHIRDGLSNVDKRVFFNSGSMGQLSIAAKRAIVHELDIVNDEKYFGKVFLRNHEATIETKEVISRLINSAPEEIVLTNSTTNGIYDVIYSFDWKRGDEVITTFKEHFAVNIPVMLLKEKFGVDISYTEIDLLGQTDIENKITSRTRLIILSHVSYSTGEILPVEEIIRIVHKHSIPVLLDGAQAVGVIPIDVKALDVDYYAFPGQKWLNGPQGIGVLYVNQSIIDNYHPNVNEEENPYPYKGIKLPTQVHRFQSASPSLYAISGFGASVKWLLDEVNTDYAYDRIQELGKLVRNRLAEIEGITVVTPLKAAGLTSFYADFIDTESLNEYLIGKGLLARTIGPFGYVRIAVSYFHTEQEIDKFIDIINEIRTKGRNQVSCELKKQYISKYANETKYLELVTINEEEYPVIRSIGSFGVDGYTVYLSTGKTTQKVSQITANEKVSILFQQEAQEISKYVNISLRGIATVLTDTEERDKAIEVISSHSPGFEDRVKSSGIENFAIIKVTPVEIKILDFSQNANGQGLDIINEF